MLSYDEAIKRALAAFHSAHPADTLPSWFETSAFRNEIMTQDGKLELVYYVEPKLPLEPNESWVETDHGPVIQWVDPVSGETRIVISRDPKKMIPLFRVVVDLFNDHTAVIEDSDISAICDQDIAHPESRA